MTYGISVKMLGRKYRWQRSGRIQEKATIEASYDGCGERKVRITVEKDGRQMTVTVRISKEKILKWTELVKELGT